MQSLFDPAGRQAVLRRLDQLQSEAGRQWGKMNAAQMLAHCSIAMEMATGETPRKQKLIGKLLGPFVRSSLLGEKPFGKNSPTDPAFIVTEEKDFEAEKQRLARLVNTFCDSGPEKASAHTHSFLGRLRGEQWGVMMYKHLDHHLRQFGC
jgi:Protein of unknown function (DUF1569)